MPPPWTLKYRPIDSSEFVDNDEAFKAVQRWLLSWKTGAPLKKAAFLFGPPGTGKTLSVSLLAKELGFDFVEMNASDYRTREAVERIAGMAATQSSLDARGKVILLDELEGMSGNEDRGGLAAIASIVKITKSPLALTAANVWSPQFSAFRESCLLIEFQRIPTRSTIPRLREICAKERVDAEEEALRVITERARGDLRSAITDLQALAQGKKSLSYTDVSWLQARDRLEPIFDVLRNIFNADTCQRALVALHTSDVDYNMVFEWIYENVPYQIPDKTELAKAMDALSKADIFLRRVQKNQEWRLLPYALEDMTAGVAMARTRRPLGWAPFKFPQRIRIMSRTRADRALRAEIGTKIGKRCHISVAVAITDYVPYLRVIFRQDQVQANRIAEWLGLEAEERKYLA